MTMTFQKTNKTPPTVGMKKLFSDRVPKGFLYIGSNPKCCLFFMMIYCVVISESMKQKTLLTGINSRS